MPEPKIAPEISWSLSTFVRDDCQQYLDFLGYVKAGATPAAAAACFGIADSTWRTWWLKFETGDKQPLIRKFGRDLTKALGAAAVVAEVSLARENPQMYAKGPSRRMLSDDHVAVDTNAVLPNNSSNTTNNVLVLSADIQRDALKCLEQAGVITVTRRTDDNLLDSSSSTR